MVGLRSSCPGKLQAHSVADPGRLSVLHVGDLEGWCWSRVSEYSWGHHKPQVLDMEHRT